MCTPINKTFYFICGELELFMHLHAYKAINKNKYLVHGVELDSDMLIVSLSVFTSMYILSVYMSYTYDT